MSVQVATLDILVDRAHLEPEVARAIGDAITMEITHSRGSLVTQDDLKLTKDELKRDINELRREMDNRFSDLAQRMEKGFADLQLEMAQHRAEMTRWMFGGFVTLFGLALGAMYVMLKLQ